MSDEESPNLDLLSGENGATLLEAAAAAAGLELSEITARDIHVHGSTMLSATFDAPVRTQSGTEPGFFVVHLSTRPVPDGATRLEVDGVTVHVWRFPYDPYLPSLAAAVDPKRAAALAGVDRDGLRARTPSYRPARRAVIALARGDEPIAYLKTWGSRSPDRAATKAARTVTVHQALAANGLPVPTTGRPDPEAHPTLISMEAARGISLRAAVASDQSQLPDPSQITGLMEAIRSTEVEPGADPDRFADPSRHVHTIESSAVAGAVDVTPAVRAADEFSSIGGPEGTVHGDLHDGQILVRDGSISGLLDVDGAGPGRLAVDAGVLAARIERAARPAGDAAWRWRDRTLRAMGDLVGLDHLARAAAVAWTGMAASALRSQGNDPTSEVADALAAAASWLDRI